MHKSFIPAATAALALAAATAGAALINEVDYDQPSTDTAEFLELLLAPGEDINNFTIDLYNGSNSTLYRTLTSADFTAGESAGGYRVYTTGVLPSNAIQNGSPDGIALLENGSVVQAIGYEGSFTAGDITFEDIGVADLAAGTETVGLVGAPGNFTYAVLDAPTSGLLNPGQAIPEPGTAGLLGLAGAGLLARRRRA